MRDYLFRHPLVVMQAIGWILYTIVDIFGHLNAGYTTYGQSIAYGFAGYLLTSIVALLQNKLKNNQQLVNSFLFVSALYLAAIIWGDFYRFIHLQADLPLFQRTQFLIEQSLFDWFNIERMPMFLFISWGGLFVGCKWFFAHQSQQNRLMSEVVEKQKAQLEALRYQLNPHFLFNALNSIDVSVLDKDTDTAHNMLQQLSHFLRTSLHIEHRDKILLKEEMNLVNSFISIEKMRFADSLNLSIHVESECEEALVPCMLIQPLVENAIKYAWSKLKSGYVDINIRKENQYLLIHVKNNNLKAQQNVGVGIGLSNTRQRLKLIYDDDAKMTVSEDTDNFQVALKLPYETYI